LATTASARVLFGDAVPTDASTATRDHTSQHWWAKQLTTPALQMHLQLLAGRDTARLSALQDPVANAWLEAPPLRQAGLTLDTQSFRALLAWRLGLPLSPPTAASAPTPLCPHCGDPIDIFGDHAVSCSHNGLWRRHFAIQHTLLRSLHNGGGACHP
jgi:hypothetical protein